MDQITHVLHELEKVEVIVENLYREQFEVEMPHAMKSRLFELDVYVKELKKLTGFIYASQGVMK